MKNNFYGVVLILFIISSCSDSVNPVDSGLENQIYHHGNGSEPQGLDPHIVTGVPEHHILISLCEGLTIPNPNPNDMNGYMAGTAESWSISDDGKEYIFNINKNAKWSNGEPVTADDFVWSWKRILTASLGSQYPDMLYYLEGAYEYHNGLIDDFDQVGVKSIDEHTLQVNLKNPTPFFLCFLSSSLISIIQSLFLNHPKSFLVLMN